MSEQSQGPGWWFASDGKWYPPESARSPLPPPPPLAAGRGPGPSEPGWWQASDGTWWPPGAAALNGYAVASIVLVFFAGIGTILALVFGYMARRRIDSSNGAQRGRGLATAGIVLGWISLAGFALVLALDWPTASRGVDPMDRMEDLHTAIEDAGIRCVEWSAGDMSGTIGTATVAEGTCELARDGGTLPIETFREDSDKYRPDAPCPRVEGEGLWIDTADVADPAVTEELANALDAKASEFPC